MLLLAFPAAAEVWSGWVGIAQKTGFGRVSPLPGIWSTLRLDTTITLPIGVEAYALRAWLATEPWISPRTRTFAKWSAICSFALGMAGQVAYHLLAQAGQSRAPWAITTIVSCLPVLVLAMGTALAHMLRDDATASQPGTGTTGPATVRSPARPPEDQTEADPDQTGGLTGVALAAANGTLLDGVIMLTPKRPAVRGGVGGGGGQRFPDRGQRGCRAVARPMHRSGVAFVHLHQRAAAEHPGWGQRKPGPVTGAAIPHTLGPRWTSPSCCGTTCPENHYSY